MTNAQETTPPPIDRRTKPATSPVYEEGAEQFKFMTRTQAAATMNLRMVGAEDPFRATVLQARRDAEAAHAHARAEEEKAWKAREPEKAEQWAAHAKSMSNANKSLTRLLAHPDMVNHKPAIAAFANEMTVASSAITSPDIKPHDRDLTVNRSHGILREAENRVPPPTAQQSMAQQQSFARQGMVSGPKPMTWTEVAAHMNMRQVPAGDPFRDTVNQALREAEAARARAKQQARNPNLTAEERQQWRMDARSMRGAKDGLTQLLARPDLAGNKEAITTYANEMTAGARSLSSTELGRDDRNTFLLGWDARMTGAFNAVPIPTQAQVNDQFVDFARQGMQLVGPGGARPIRVVDANGNELNRAPKAPSTKLSLNNLTTRAGLTELVDQAVKAVTHAVEGVARQLPLGLARPQTQKVDPVALAQRANAVTVTMGQPKI